MEVSTGKYSDGFIFHRMIKQKQMNLVMLLWAPNESHCLVKF